MAEDKKTTKNASGTTKPKKTANKEAEQDTQDTPESAQTVAMQWAVGMVIAALIVGMGIGYTIAPKSDVPGVSAPSGTGAPSDSSAPALSPDQLNNGQLPPGHVPIDETSTPGASTQTPEPTK